MRFGSHLVTRLHAVFARASYDLLRIAGRRAGLREDGQTPQVRICRKMAKANCPPAGDIAN